jgi:peroxiredoxin
MPRLSLPRAGGGVVQVGDSTSWQAVIVYRGKHCPICRTYLKTLDGLLDQFSAANTEVIAISGDPREKAESEANEENWRFPVGYDLRPDQMRLLGLYISEPRSPQETDRPFAEPGLFIINPQGKIQVVDISNAVRATRAWWRFEGAKVYPGKAVPHSRHASLMMQSAGTQRWSADRRR